MTASAAIATAACTAPEDADLFHFRLHANVAGIDPSILAELDTVAELCRDSVIYRHCFPMENGCDLFDVRMMAKWAHSEGLVSKAVLAAFTTDRPPFLTAQEVAKRLEIADGSCPLCETTPSFHAFGTYEPDRHTTLGHCGHFGYTHIADLDFLHHPRAWQGARWPFVLGERVADDNGYPLDGRARFAFCCSGCRKTSAFEVVGAKVEAILFDLVLAGRKPEFQCKGSAPMIGFDPDALKASVSDPLPERTVQRVRDIARQIVKEGNSEFRLNGCGLKVYAHGVQLVGNGFRQIVTFDMFVGGDSWERDMFAAFVKLANDRIKSEKLRYLRSEGSGLECHR